MKKIKKAFTLIELLITITILAILTTIAFLSLQNFTRDTRDSVRISTLKTIHEGLQISQTQTGNYPIPDEYTDVVGVSYQGYIGETTSKIIKLSGKTTDPLDNKNYIYSLDKSKTKIQLSTYLENTNSNYFTYKPYLLNQTYATNTVDYTKRYLYTLGDRIGILLDKDTNKPIQEIYNTGSLNLITNTGTYIVQFTNSKTNSGTIQGSGQNLLTNISIIQNSCVLGNTVVQNGGQITAYNTGSVAYNETCNPVIRKCTNGKLDNQNETYIYDTCIPATPLNCLASTYSGAVITALNHLQSQNFTTAINYGTGDLTATCTNGNLTYSSINTVCQTNYITSSPWNCILDTCSGTMPTYAQQNGTQGTASWSYDTNPGVCKFVCQVGYYRNGTACIPASTGYYVASAGQNTQTACTTGQYQDSTAQTTFKSCTNKPANSSYTVSTALTTNTCPWSCDPTFALNGSICSKNPTNLSLTHSTRTNTFTFSWTAGVGNGGSCKLQYNKNGIWTNISETIYDCDFTLSGASVTLPGGSWYSGNWNGVQVRVIRTSDNAELGILGSLTCSTTSGSSSPTPTIDEDCDGVWDNVTSGTPSIFNDNCYNWFNGAGTQGCNPAYPIFVSYYTTDPFWCWKCKTVPGLDIYY